MTGQSDRTSVGTHARTFLIADIRGYTAYTARHGDQAASRLAREFAEVAAEGVEAWSGELVELRGDEALAVFDSPPLAVRAAIELQDAFADEAACDASLPLAVGIGIDAGEAVVVGNGYRGSALNLAARLCSVSKAGEIHASVGLIDLTGGLDGVALDEVSGLRLKGFDGDQRAYSVRASERPTTRADPVAVPRPLVASTAPAGLGSEAPLAGRGAEMRWLGWHWRRARHGHARVLAIRGPDGVGKTRLATALAALAATEGAWITHATGLTTELTQQVLQGAGAAPGLLIVDGSTADRSSPDVEVAAVSRLSEVNLDAALLTVIVKPSANGKAAMHDPGDAIPAQRQLEVAPLGIDGVRELAGMLSPETADELPLTRILEESGGLPGVATIATREWAQRIAAERGATQRQEAAIPAERSSFIGRASELEIGAELLGTSRLLTLVGPPGTGKTRLARRMASDLADEYPGGAFFVPLAPVADPQFVGSAVARAMHVRETKEATALDVVKAYLAGRRALLVLDNFEHLLDAAPLVAELLDAAPGLTVLATSRTTLGLSSEQVYPVPPLRVPPVAEACDADRLQAYDAVALFAARARTADPGFSINTSNAAAVAQITARLEGLPLAIELAAARIRTLTPHVLLEGLEQRLRLLTGGPADSADRHRTMRDAIAWSYELLEEDDRSLLRSLAVFRGGFTLDALTQVANLATPDALDGIGSLVSKSLVHRVDGARHGRFAMLEMVREFAIEALEASGERSQAADRHAQVYAALAHGVEPQLEGEAAGDGLERLNADYANVRAALEHALAEGNTDIGFGLASSIWRFWQSTGHLREGRHWLDRALALEGGSPQARAKACAALAGLAYWQGEFPTSQAHYEQARDLFRAAGERLGEADAIYSLSLVASYQGKLDEADRLADEAKAIFEELGAEAKVGEVVMAQGLASWTRGDLPRALALVTAALEISMRFDNHALAASQLIGVAGVAFQQGDLDAALLAASEALDLSIGTSNTHTQIFALDSIASFAAAFAPVEAVRLCSAAATLREAHGGGWTLESFGVECARVAVKSSLDEAELEAAWKVGGSLDLDEAIGLARLILQTRDVHSG